MCVKLKSENNVVQGPWGDTRFNFCYSFFYKCLANWFTQVLNTIMYMRCHEPQMHNGYIPRSRAGPDQKNALQLENHRCITFNDWNFVFPPSLSLHHFQTRNLDAVLNFVCCLISHIRSWISFFLIVLGLLIGLMSKKLF